MLREHDPLRFTGRTAGKDDRQQVIRLDLVKAEPAVEDPRGQVRLNGGDALIKPCHLGLELFDKDPLGSFELDRLLLQEALGRQHVFEASVLHAVVEDLICQRVVQVDRRAARECDRHIRQVSTDRWRDQQPHHLFIGLENLADKVTTHGQRRDQDATTGQIRT